MAMRARPALIGTFVLGGIALAVGAILLLGGRQWFSHPLTCVMGFDGSVAGLIPDAPVRFRGVQVGTVARIELRPRTPVITVVVHIDPLQVRGLPAPIAPAETERIIEEHVRKGLRAQLEPQSLLTGQLYVALDYHPETPARLLGLDEGHCEIPTIPTAIAQFQEQVTTILAKLEHVPLEDVAAAATRTLGAIENLATEPDIPRILANLDGATKDARVLITSLNTKMDPTVTSLQRAAGQAERTLDEVGQEVRRLLRDVDARIVPLAADIRATTDSTRALVQEARGALHNLDAEIGPTMAAFRDAADAARDAMREVKSTTGQVNGVLDGESPLGYQLSEALEQLTRTSRALRTLSEEIERQPNVLLFGRGKAKRE